MARLRISCLLLLLLPLGLAGCFAGKTQLIGEDKAVAPFARISYAERESTGKPQVFIRDGKTYRISENGETGTARFMDTGDGTYVAEFGGRDGSGEQQFLYALLKVDFSARTAEGYKAIAGDADANPGPGLVHCDQTEVKQVCVENLDAYIAYAKAAIAAGAKPDMVWTFTTE